MIIENRPRKRKSDNFEFFERTWERVETHGESYTARTGHSVVEYEGCFYIFGGTDSSRRRNDLHKLDTKDMSWTQISPRRNNEVPWKRSGAKAVVVEGKMYLFGGYDGRGGNYFNDLQEYDIKTNTWTDTEEEGEEYPSPRTDHTLVHYHGKLYIFGGYDGRLRLNDLFEFDLDSLVWTKLAQNNSYVPVSRFGHTAVVDNDDMYVFGGWDGHETLNSMWRYSFLSDLWTPHRYRHCSMVLNGRMYIFGGVDKYQTRFNDLHEFDFKTSRWKKVCTTPVAPKSRTFHPCSVFNNQIYIFGGFDGENRLNDVHRLYLGRLSPRPLVEMTRDFALKHMDLYEKTIRTMPVAIVYGLLWKKDDEGVYRGPYNSEEDRVLCSGFKPVPYPSYQNLCSGCGKPANLHREMIPAAIEQRPTLIRVFESLRNIPKRFSNRRSIKQIEQPEPNPVGLKSRKRLGKKRISAQRALLDITSKRENLLRTESETDVIKQDDTVKDPDDALVNETGSLNLNPLSRSRVKLEKSKKRKLL
eukprot:maker-scaffold_1-snap-gene-15.40-mRNA-1 protein AED:0.26 eAED:0.26 QI:0/0/0/1/0/0/3/0/526